MNTEIDYTALRLQLIVAAVSAGAAGCNAVEVADRTIKALKQMLPPSDEAPKEPLPF